MAIIRRGEGSPLARRSWAEWDPFQAMSEMMRWDPLRELGQGSGEGIAFAPAFDLRETKDAFVFKADLPGFKEEDIHVDLTGNRMTVSGKREAEKVEDDDRYYCCERSYGSFTRTFTLPDGVDTERIGAEMKNGVLSISAPKTEQAQPRRISVGQKSQPQKAKA
jgi:HSP20 family protein